MDRGQLVVDADAEFVVGGGAAGGVDVVERGVCEVGLGVELVEAGGDLGDARRREAVARELLEGAGGGVVREGVENGSLAGEVALSERPAGDAGTDGGGLPDAQALVVAEEERLVAAERAAERPAELIALEGGLGPAGAKKLRASSLAFLRNS
jgi:hypothetical protein